MSAAERSRCYRAKRKALGLSLWKRTPEQDREKARKERMEHPEKVLARCRLYYERHKDKINKKARDKRAANLEESRANRREYERRRRRDPFYRLVNSISRSLRKNITKEGNFYSRTIDRLGYTKEELRAHLESHFEDGMTWGNYGKGPGKWNIEHRRPIVSFKHLPMTEYQIRFCWGLRNLRPVWELDNLSKQAKWCGQNWRSSDVST